MMSSCRLSILLLLLSLSPSSFAQKLVVIVADGLGGSLFHRFSHLPGLRTFEEEGVWSTKLFPVFPTLPLPNRQTLMTGVLPRRHGLHSSYIFDHRSGETFNNFSQPSDYDQGRWWALDPIYITAMKAKASVAMFFFPECRVDWNPSISHCMPPRSGFSFSDEAAAKAVVAATKTHDLVMVYHPQIGEEISRIGPKRANEKTATEVDLFQQSLERLTAQARERIDLNVIVVSTHGMTDVPRRQIRVLDDYLPMELINITVGSGAIMQILAKNGKTHQVYTQLRQHNPIPNVKVYYTASKIGDMPSWYHYKRSSTIADLVLIAQPGYAIISKDVDKAMPPGVESKVQLGVSGYNNQYPDMLGVFLAFGPMFKKGYRKGPVEIADIYHLMCNILKIGCHKTPRRLVRIDDVLTSDARVAMRASSFERLQFLSITIPLFLLIFLLG